MRIAIVTDIHGNLPALQAVWAEIERAAPDVIVNLGDIASGPLWPRETLQWLMAREAADPSRWVTIRGNHERQVLSPGVAPMGASDAYAARALGEAERAWLTALPPARWLAPAILLCHATPGTDVQYFLETTEPGYMPGGSPGVRPASATELRERAAQRPTGALDGPGLDAAPARDLRTGLDAELILCGHTHVPRMVSIPGGPLVVNTGSVGLPGFEDGHAHRHIVQTGSPHARWGLVERAAGSPSWRVELRATAYDWAAASARAEANGRGDWADVLATGFVGRFEGDATFPGGPAA